MKMKELLVLSYTIHFDISHSVKNPLSIKYSFIKFSEFQNISNLPSYSFFLWTAIQKLYNISLLCSAQKKGGRECIFSLQVFNIRSEQLKIK